MLLLASGGLAAGSVARPYHPAGEIPVGGDGGWDYLTMDSAAHRLYVSHGTAVDVIDTIAGKVVGRVEDTPGVHGIAVAADLHRGFTTNGRENKASLVDLASLRTLGKVDTGAGPDSLVYEPGRREVFVFNGRDSTATVIDAVAGKAAATIPLGGRPESAAVDGGLGRVFVDLEDRDAVAAIDPAARVVAARWTTAPGGEPAGLAVDEAHHRLFIGCHNERMVMMDAASGRILATVPIGRGVDAAAFDPGTQLAFASCGDGTVTVAHEDTPEQLTVVQTLHTEPRARTMALDPATHRIYLASARFEAAPEPAAGTPRPRPKMVPGSFKILVYSQD
ncbi:MAG TPA: YncE family protein [Lacunisphaera sp.]|nr:YncE family protein [Lacunisphaera sp.]